MRRAILGALLLVLGLGALPAHAGSTFGSVSGVDGVLYDDCLPHPYAYSIGTVPADAKTWDLRVTLLGPDGLDAGGDFVATPVSTGTRAFVLCPPANAYGTYTIRARFEWGTGDVADQSAPLDDAHFTLRKPGSRTSLAVSTRRPAYGQVVRYRVGAFDEQPTGYLRRAFAWVHLEKRVDGRWVRMRGGRAMTHETGEVVIRLRYRAHHRTLRVRAVTETAPRFTGSTSPVLRLW